MEMVDFKGFLKRLMTEVTEMTAFSNSIYF